MTMRESNIVYQNGPFWVAKLSQSYTVYRDGATVAKADSSYPLTDDGRSLAVARCTYLAKRLLRPA
jgi:hypothetical protein